MKSFVFPGNIEQDILDIGAKQIPYMRTQEFSAINKESEQILLDLIGCRNGRTIIYTGSGTGAMEAIVQNYVSTMGKAFVINGGSFGKRWVQLCDYYKIPRFEYKVDFAKDINYEDLELKVKAERPSVFLCQHHETSSGQLFDLAKISAICKKHKASLVVDVISSFLAEPLDMDDLGIDLCVTSTQKGLNLPPGLAIVFIANHLKTYPFAHKGMYFDFEDNLKNLERGQTPFSPATTIFLQLNERLRRLKAEGGAGKNIERVRQRALFFRKLCEKNQWEMPAETPSYAITGIQLQHPSVFRALIEKHDTFIMPGGKEGFFRVSHMGLQDEKDLENLANQIAQSQKPF